MIDGRERLDRFIEGSSTWSTLVHLDEVDSTNDEVARRVRDTAAAGAVLVADRQSAGRGRQGRAWQEAPDGNLSVSVTVGVPGDVATLVPLAAGLAACDALTRQGLRPALKWPNDVLLPTADDRLAKCGGILADVHDLRSSAGSLFLVVGIGLDLDWRGTPRTGEAAGWTSVAEQLDRDVDRWEVLHDLLRAFEAWLLDVPNEPTRLLARYTARCSTLGQVVRVTAPGGEAIEGQAVDVREDGALLVDTPAGRRAVLAGDVEAVRPG